MSTAAEPRPAELPLPGGHGGATVKLHPLLSASTAAPPAYLHRDPGRLGKLRALGAGVPRSQYVPIPIVAFLVEHPSAGAILIDTGFHPSVAVDPTQNLGRLGARVFAGVKMDPSDAVSAQLRARGIDPGDVGLVVMTHLHIDHASAMSEYPEATFVFTAREWEAATDEQRPWLHGYRRRQFDHAFDYRLLDFEALEVESYATFGRAIDLLGDGSVRLVYTPGHTHGHMSVILRLGDREALVAGDAIFTRRTLDEGIPPWRVEDEHLFGRSVKEIQLYSQTTDALVIPGHDMAFWKTLEAVYE
jgi:glyoxylase-like metal-dependent hydrolase (beta-lactamase superfamily II)